MDTTNSSMDVVFGPWTEADGDLAASIGTAILRWNELHQILFVAYAALEGEPSAVAAKRYFKLTDKQKRNETLALARRVIGEDSLEFEKLRDVVGLADAAGRIRNEAVHTT